MANISKDAFRSILKRHRKGTATEEERRYIEEWFVKVQSGADIHHSDVEEESKLKEKMWNAITREVPEVAATGASFRGRMLRQRGYLMAVAASVLVLMLSLVYLVNRRQSPSRGIGNDLAFAGGDLKEVVNLDVVPKEVVLPDGSRITLEQNSKIVFLESFDQPKREVSFEGEAFFEIARNPARPFFVYTNNVVTKVLGTSFLIKAFQSDQEILVAVKTGKVSVYTQSVDGKSGQDGVEETVLTPNEQIIYNKPRNTLSKTLVADPVPMASKETLETMHFENAPIADIFHSLENVYQVKIDFDEQIFAECKLTTTISKGGIFKRLDIICTAIKASYRVEGTRIEITGSGCGKWPH